MCGICGIWHSLQARGGDLRAQVEIMTSRLRHRGPDDDGTFLDETSEVALGFRRLSIVDLSREGHQPMVSPSGRYVIVFNGEIYNHQRLRPQLEATGFSFRGHSDTEVVLASIERCGLDRALKGLIGMFAFALWDHTERRLTLVRDRVGIKPLYYGWVHGCFAFASEPKALAALPDFDNPIDCDALCLFLRYGAVPAPYSIYQGIAKLMPGTKLELDAGLIASHPSAHELVERARPYWSGRALAEDAARQRTPISPADAVGGLDALLHDAVTLRAEADVPLGAFLSGGVDSSTVVALMQRESSRPVETFTIGFSEREYDEARYARAIAQHLGTDHHELYVSPGDALQVVPLLPEIYDEPFGDSSAIPTYLVAKLARSRVTVSLSGDGGDELFGGYGRYLVGRDLCRLVERIPTAARKSLGAIIRAVPRDAWDRLSSTLGPRRGSGPPPAGYGRKLSRLADALQDHDMDGIYRRLASQWTSTDDVVLAGHAPATLLDTRPLLDDFTERMLWYDFSSYLPDDILTKVDRATMAVGLEARVPLLDHRVVEYAWRTPIADKIRADGGKWLLRQVLYRYVPRTLVDRPKRGFEIPLKDWLRGPLRGWAESLLNAERLRAEGYLNPTPIRAKWAEHLSGRQNWQHLLWNVLMFQAWLGASRGIPNDPLAERDHAVANHAA